MSERATVTQVTQIGVETTPGTGVSADKLLQAVTIEPSIQADVTTFRPQGGKWATLAALGKEWVEAAISGPGVYTDIVYLLSSVLSYAAPAQQGSTSAYKWTFAPAQSSEDTVKTFTVEHGSDVRAGKFTYGLVNELGISIDREAVEVSGTMFGQAYQDGVTLTASPTAVAVQPILPTEVAVYLDTTSGGIGSTKLTRCLGVEFNVSDRFGQVWPLDSAVSGFAAHMETVPQATLALLVEADSSGMAPLTAMRAGDKRYIRVKAEGPTIEETYKWTFQIDLCGVVSEVSDFSDEDGVYAIQWTFQAAYDSGWDSGKAFQVEVINTLSDL